MLRGMVFMDHLNFDIAIKEYYKNLNSIAPKLDYNKLFKKIVQQRPEINYMKTFIFAPKPDDFLMNDNKYQQYYQWVIGLKSSKYIDVVEGRYVARPTDDETSMNINDTSTYYKVEKGTDLNLAIHALSKAFNNAYDVAFIMSADTDYISLYKQLKMIGKIVIVVTIKGQNIKNVRPEVDDYIFLDDTFFNSCIRQQTFQEFEHTNTSAYCLK